MIKYEFKFDEDELQTQELAARERLASEDEDRDAVDPLNDPEFAAYKRAWVVARTAGKFELEGARNVAAAKTARIAHEAFYEALR